MSDHRHSMGASDTLERCPIMPNYGPPPVMFVRGSGTELWDRDGKRYLDFLCGLAVTSLGHADHTRDDGWSGVLLTTIMVRSSR